MIFFLLTIFIFHQTQTKENDLDDDDPRTYEEVTFAPKDTLQVTYNINIYF